MNRPKKFVTATYIADYYYQSNDLNRVNVSQYDGGSQKPTLLQAGENLASRMSPIGESLLVRRGIIVYLSKREEETE